MIGMDKIFEMFEPVSSTTIIWRYMSLVNFIDLLKNRELYFSSVKNFLLNDPWEGSFRNLINNDALDINSKLSEEDLKIVRDILTERTYVNCWHINETDSDAMWKIYSKNKGVAITSFVKSLKQVLIESNEKFIVGKIKYETIDKKEFILGNTYEPFFRKRKSFEHEREFRAIFWNHHTILKEILFSSIDKHINIKLLNPTRFKKFKIDVNRLISKIYLHPQYKLSEVEIIKDLIKKYEYEFDVEKSYLLSDPIF